MKIGFVYDLRDDYRALGYSEESVAEFDTPETISDIADALANLGHTVDRIGHGQKLASRLVAGERWDMVFSIAEGVRGRSREAQVPALLELFDQPYVFSDPLTMAATLDKSVAKQIVRGSGVPTATSWTAESGADIASADIAFPAFVKPVAEGTGKGCDSRSRVENRQELISQTTRLAAQFAQPVLIETFLPGREFTVGVVGTGPAARVIAVMEVAVRDTATDPVYSLENKELCETFVTYTLADDDEASTAGAYALAAYRALGCRDAARLDFKSDSAGVPHFLEANPIAGLNPHHSDLPILATKAGMSYESLIGEILTSACARCGSLPETARQASN
ncbi:MAG: D-alanine--D-alanine ligase [Proteobacteria bacterium]|nr:D-alanine--D-alanine ligase [Pseudomonadota bacterium]